MTEQSINSLLQAGSQPFGSLLAKVQCLQRWNKWLREALGDYAGIADHCQIVNMSGTALIVIAENAHWSTALSFHIPRLLTALRQHPELAKITAICSKVKPPQFLTSPHHAAKRAQLQLSPSSAQSLRMAADQVHDEKLRGILLRLAERAKK